MSSYLPVLDYGPPVTSKADKSKVNRATHDKQSSKPVQASQSVTESKLKSKSLLKSKAKASVDADKNTTPPVSSVIGSSQQEPVDFPGFQTGVIISSNGLASPRPPLELEAPTPSLKPSRRKLPSQRKAAKPPGVREEEEEEHRKKRGQSQEEDERLRKAREQAVAHAEALQAQKTAVFSVQLALLEGAAVPAQLAAAQQLLVQSELDDLASERALATLCGNLACANSLTGVKQRKGRFRISLKDQKVYDNEEASKYCSSACMVSARALAVALPAKRDRLRGESELRSLMEAVRNPSATSGTAAAAPAAAAVAGGNGRAASKEPEDPRAFKGELPIRERQVAPAGVGVGAAGAGAALLAWQDFSRAGPSDAIEGYIPQRREKRAAAAAAAAPVCPSPPGTLAARQQAQAQGPALPQALAQAKGQAQAQQVQEEAQEARMALEAEEASAAAHARAEVTLDHVKKERASSRGTAEQPDTPGAQAPRVPPGAAAGFSQPALGDHQQQQQQREKEEQGEEYLNRSDAVSQIVAIVQSAPPPPNLGHRRDGFLDSLLLYHPHHPHRHSQHHPYSSVYISAAAAAGALPFGAAADFTGPRLPEEGAREPPRPMPHEVAAQQSTDAVDSKLLLSTRAAAAPPSSSLSSHEGGHCQQQQPQEEQEREWEREREQEHHRQEQAVDDYPAADPASSPTPSPPAPAPAPATPAQPAAPHPPSSSSSSSASFSAPQSPLPSSNPPLPAAAATAAAGAPSAGAKLEEVWQRLLSERAQYASSSASASASVSAWGGEREPLWGGALRLDERARSAVAAVAGALALGGEEEQEHHHSQLDVLRRSAPPSPRTAGSLRSAVRPSPALKRLQLQQQQQQQTAAGAGAGPGPVAGPGAGDANGPPAPLLTRRVSWADEFGEALATFSLPPPPTLPETPPGGAPSPPQTVPPQQPALSPPAAVATAAAAAIAGTAGAAPPAPESESGGAQEGCRDTGERSAGSHSHCADATGSQPAGGKEEEAAAAEAAGNKSSSEHEGHSGRGEGRTEENAQVEAAEAAGRGREGQAQAQTQAQAQGGREERRKEDPRVESARALAELLAQAARAAALGDVPESRAAESFGIGIRPEGPPLPPLSALSSLPLGSSGEAAQSLSGWSRAAEGQLAEAEATTTTAQRTRRRKKGTAGAGSSTRRARQDAGAGEEEEEGNEEEWEEQELEEGEGEEEDEEEEDADALGRQADWSDAPPEGFRAELSTFGTLWMALEEWVSAEAVAFILGQPYSREEEGTLEVEGRQYQPQVSPPAGSSSSGVSVAIARTFSDCVGRALPELIQRLRMTVSLSLVEQTLARLVNRLSFVEALPPLGTLQWRLVALLLLEAAGAHHVPAVAAHLSSQKKLFHQVIESTGTSVEEYLIFRQLTLPKDSSKALFAEASPRKGA